MIQIFVIHNDEQDRLEYLLPKANALRDFLNTTGKIASLELIGPDAAPRPQEQHRDNLFNRFRRAMDASSTSFFHSINDPARSSLAKELAKRARCLYQGVFSHRRSIAVEQDLLYKHVLCWSKSAQSGRPAVVLESDAVFNEFSERALLALLDYLRNFPPRHDLYYVDLAGGCNKAEILNSWCFKSGNGCRNVTPSLAPEICLHLLPRFTINTTGGYLIGPGLAAELFRSVLARRPILPVDWAMMSFAASSEIISSSVCIHTTPTVFRPGSSSGDYQSGIDPRRN